MNWSDYVRIRLENDDLVEAIDRLFDAGKLSAEVLELIETKALEITESRLALERKDDLIGF